MRVKRIAIIFDGHAWFVRHIRVSVHDLALDEKVYRCDQPISGPHTTLDEAVRSYKASSIKKLRRRSLV